MTCLINARAYRDGSAAAPRWPDTSYWVLLGLSWARGRGLVHEHLVPRCTGRGASETGHHVSGCADGHRSSQRLRESAVNTFFLFPAGPGVGPGWVRGRVLAFPFGIQLAVACGTTDWLLAHVIKAASKRCSSGTEFSNGRVDCASGPA